MAAMREEFKPDYSIDGQTIRELIARLAAVEKERDELKGLEKYYQAVIRDQQLKGDELARERDSLKEEVAASQEMIDLFEKGEDYLRAEVEKYKQLAEAAEKENEQLHKENIELRQGKIFKP